MSAVRAPPQGRTPAVGPPPPTCESLGSAGLPRPPSPSLLWTKPAGSCWVLGGSDCGCVVGLRGTALSPDLQDLLGASESNRLGKRLKPRSLLPPAGQLSDSNNGHNDPLDRGPPGSSVHGSLQARYWGGLPNDAHTRGFSSVFGVFWF